MDEILLFFSGGRFYPPGDAENVGKTVSDIIHAIEIYSKHGNPKPKPEMAFVGGSDRRKTKQIKIHTK